jgi:hypothetical protein
MLDVHPPHHPAHSWRDFFIHIATIVVGLIIAVGLEQTVEAIHRHHERVELEGRLRREAEDNIAALDQGRKSWETLAAWEASVVSLLQTAPQQAGLITITLPTYDNGRSQTTQRAAWNVAKANGTVALLPESEAEVFDRIDWLAEQEDLAYHKAREAWLEEQAAEAAAGVSFDSGKTVHFAIAQRDSLLKNMAKRQIADAAEAYWLADCELADMAVRENPTSVAELLQTVRRMAPTLSAK